MIVKALHKGDNKANNNNPILRRGEAVREARGNLRPEQALIITGWSEKENV
jgi:hypothetical protein